MSSGGGGGEREGRSEGGGWRPWGVGLGRCVWGGRGGMGGEGGETAETRRSTRKILSFYKILVGFVRLVLLSRIAGESEVVYRR